MYHGLDYLKENMDAYFDEAAKQGLTEEDAKKYLFERTLHCPPERQQEGSVHSSTTGLFGSLSNDAMRWGIPRPCYRESRCWRPKHP